ncbi:MAG: serine hydrolase [Candidatus Buchananbacteria bacterium]
MKKIVSYILFFTLTAAMITPSGVLAAAKKTATNYKSYTATQLSGRLALQANVNNRFWYVTPDGQTRYIVENDVELYEMVAQVGVDIAAADIAKFTAKKKLSSSFLKKYSGKFIFLDSRRSQIYYINPGNGYAYRIATFNKVFDASKTIGLKVADASLRRIPMNDSQFTYDPLFNDIAYVSYNGNKYDNSYHSQTILPLASLSKVMTALVLKDQNLDWNKIIEITAEEIRYPCTLQPCGSTSEVNLKAGDKARMGDLWIAMLTSSSNQSAVILSDNSGLTREEFVKKMNEKAKALGLVKTYFEEMSGLSAKNISTAEEFAVIAKAAFDNEHIASGTRFTDYVFTVEQADGSTREVEVSNRNYSLLAFEPTASKTGYLVEAQRNAAIAKDGKVIVVLHAASLTQRNNIVAKVLAADQLAAAP